MICAEPLEFVACGPCGHRDACVECVARLRFVMDDRRCVICQQQCPRMFATRHVGAYTETLGGEAGFEALPRRVASGELWRDETLDIFFDDRAVWRRVKELRGLQCAACVASNGGVAEGVPHHASLKQLRAHLREKHQLHHCDTCVEGRKVFVSQQLLYTRAQLDRHNHGAAGEVDEPLGSFAGHPACKFCGGKRFYDEGALYHHMQSAHETCHLCRRAHPDKFVYFRNYDELEAHYAAKHHPCLHPDCLAKKFVVFLSPNELKNHEGIEHGRAMTKAERKEALRLHVDFSVGNGSGSGNGNGNGNAAEERNARGGPRGGFGGAPGDASLSRARRDAVDSIRGAARDESLSDAERAQLEAVLRASAGEEVATNVPRPPSMEEFPDLGGGGARGGAGGFVGGGWAGRGGRSAGGGGGGSRGSSRGASIGGAEDFPSLARASLGPASSRARVGPGGGVGGGSSASAGGGGNRRAPAPPPDLAPGLAARFAEAAAGTGAGYSGAAGGAGGRRGGGARGAGGAGGATLDASESNFPSLGGSGGGGGGGRGAPLNSFDRRREAAAADARRLAPASSGPARSSGGRGGARWGRGGVISVDFDDDFPPGPSRARGGRGAGGKEAASAEAAEAAAAASASASAAATRDDRVVADIRASLEAHGASFDVFSNLSAQFRDARVSAPAYLGKVRAMGVALADVAALAALMPAGDEKRDALERAVEAARRVDSRRKPAEGGGFGSGSGEGVVTGERPGGEGGGGSSAGGRNLARGGIGRGGAVDAAAAMLGIASGAGGSGGEWDCPACTFRNAAASARCDVCDGARAGGGGGGGAAAGAGAEPARRGHREGASGGGGGGKKRSGRGVKVSLTAVGGGGVGNLDAFIPGRNAPAWGS